MDDRETAALNYRDTSHMLRDALAPVLPDGVEPHIDVLNGQVVVTTGCRLNLYTGLLVPLEDDA